MLLTMDCEVLSRFIFRNLGGGEGIMFSGERRSSIAVRFLMWWRPFLDCLGAIGDLPSDRLRQLNQSAVTQLKQMQERGLTLQSQISDGSYEFCCQVESSSTAQLPADLQRHHQLASTVRRLQFDIAGVDQEVVAQQLLHSEMNCPPAELPAQLREICSKLVDVALTSRSRTDRDDCLFCLDLVTGGLKFITATIGYNTQIFQCRSLELRRELDVLIGTTARLVRKVFELRRALENAASQPAPFCPRPRAQLEAEIAELGESREVLLRERRRAKENRKRRDELQNECAALSAEVLVRSADGSNIQAVVDMRHELLRVQVRADELRQLRSRLESEVRGVRALTSDARQDVDDAKQQCRKLLSEMEDARMRLQMLAKANVGAGDVEFVAKCALQGTVADLQAALEEKVEHLQLLKRKRGNLQEKGRKLHDQEQQIDAQIVELTELMQTAKAAEQMAVE
jgi:hypothetical protein